MSFFQSAIESAKTWLSANITSILVALAILIVGYMIAKSIAKSFSKVLVAKGVDKAAASFIQSVSFVSLVIVVLIISLSHLGFQTSSLIAILGAAGLAIGLALKDSLSNIASGIMLITVKPFKAGDFVETSGLAGVVEKIEIFTTTFKTPDNKLIVLPNSTITGATITNFSKLPTRRVDLVIGISYDSDLRKAKQILIDTLDTHPLILKEPEAKVAVSQLADSSVNFNVRPWVNKDDYWPVHNELLETIKLKFDEEGIEIPFPQMSVHLSKEES